MSPENHIVLHPQPTAWEPHSYHSPENEQNINPNPELKPSDLLLFLALKTWENQLPPTLKLESDLPPGIQLGIKTYWGSYQRVCETIHHLLLSLTKLDAIAQSCQQSLIGKKLPNALYVHTFALTHLDPLLQIYERWSRRAIDDFSAITLVKFHTNQPLISYLIYPDFDADPHPALLTSIQVNLKTGSVSSSDYADSDNPPILHRKETFVTPDYPHYKKFAKLTQAEEKLGLLDRKTASSSSNPEQTNFYRTIGTRKGWDQILEKYGVRIQDHQVITPTATDRNFASLTPKIERHKAALPRKTLSRPLRLALEAQLFEENTSFFDYGCGYGGDVQRLAEQGYVCAGWDPYYSPDTPRVAADIVNLGYVINVIECQNERREALINAWNLTKNVLIVAAQVLVDAQEKGIMAYADGVITNRNTFQKYYQQEELKIYIDQVLNVDAIPIDLGVYFVFRDETQAQTFQASRFRSRLTSPRICLQVKRFEDYQELLTPLMAFVSDRGRLPIPQELPQESEILAEFGNYKRAFKLILQATNPQDWEDIADKRRQDFLVYLALSRFDRRPKPSQLSTVVKNDIRGLFGSYRKACELADQMLYSMGNLDMIATHCHQSLVGQKRAHSLWIHVSALEKLDPLLRLYEGCASRTIGRPDGATLVKFHIKTPKISYLFYPGFDTEPHPTLHSRMDIHLRDLHVTYQSYDGPNPPILHRKEMFLSSDYPNYQQFAKLSHQEENWGLFDNFPAIQTRLGWLKCLEDHCAEIRGYRVYWRSDADPYQIKLVQSARRARQKSNPMP